MDIFPNISSAIRRRLIEIGNAEDADIDLGMAALILAAADRPGVPLEPYQRHLDGIAAEVGAYVGQGEDESNPKNDLELRIEALVQVIVRRYGYGGGDDVFDDLDAANLMRVIDSRSGLPVALGIIFMATGRALGWDISGLDFPGRFLVRLEAGGERKIIDPFGDGAVIEAPDLRDMFKAMAGNHVELTPRHYRDASNRGILLRLQGNIKSRLVRGERWDDAVEAIETMVLFAPGETDLWHEAGLLHARLDHLEDAVRALEEYLRQTGGEDVRYNASVLLQELRAKLN
ncbi:MAG TPA: transglutaminase-like domain-containing protein [Rhodospirillales bacterium]|jgi:regulator of sirC expression with transglutaminase-like and TPR domain|nr:transglutaminase-like domain-containing protein [Rhodospirillales bacterium]